MQATVWPRVYDAKSALCSNREGMRPPEFPKRALCTSEDIERLDLGVGVTKKLALAII